MGQLLLACLLAGPLLVETVHSESDWLDTDKDSLRDSLALDSHKARNKEDSLDLDSHKARHKEDSPTLASPSQARGVARQGGGLLGDVYNFLADPEMLQRRQVGAVTGVSTWRRMMMIRMKVMMKMMLMKIFILVISRRMLMMINDDDDDNNGLCLFLLPHIPLLGSFFFVAGGKSLLASRLLLAKKIQNA